MTHGLVAVLSLAKGSHNIANNLYLAEAEKMELFLCNVGKIWEKRFFLWLSFNIENISTLKFRVRQQHLPQLH